MKNVLFLMTIATALSACGAFHAKQPIDETYYKRSQSIAWEEPQPVVQPIVRQTYTNSATIQGQAVPGNMTYTISGVDPETGQPFTVNMNVNAMGLPIQ